MDIFRPRVFIAYIAKTVLVKITVIYVTTPLKI